MALCEVDVLEVSALAPSAAVAADLSGTGFFRQAAPLCSQDVFLMLFQLHDNEDASQRRDISPGNEVRREETSTITGQHNNAPSLMPVREPFSNQETCTFLRFFC